MGNPIKPKYPKVIKETIEDIESINKKLNDDNDLAVAIEAKTIATNNKSDIDNLKAQQNANIKRLDEINAIANEGNERSKVNTQRLDSIQGKAEAAYNQISRIDSIQGRVNVLNGQITVLQSQVPALIGDVNANKTNINNLINRMDSTEGKANGADQRSLLNSNHIEELYSKVYENANNKHIGYHNVNSGIGDYELKPNTINILSGNSTITITPEKIQTNGSYDGIFYYKYYIMNNYVYNFDITIKIINIDNTSEFIEKTINITQATDDINTFILELYIINSWWYYFASHDSNHNPQPMMGAILIKETPIKTYNYLLN